MSFVTFYQQIIVGEKKKGGGWECHLWPLLRLDEGRGVILGVWMEGGKKKGGGRLKMPFVAFFNA